MKKIFILFTTLSSFLSFSQADFPEGINSGGDVIIDGHTRFRRFSDGLPTAKIGYKDSNFNFNTNIDGGGGNWSVSLKEIEKLKVDEFGDVIAFQNVYAKNFSDLKGKKWKIFGDSFSNTLDPDDYPYYVIQSTGLSAITFAVAGSRLNDQLVTLKNILITNPNYFIDTDIVSLHIGVNDFAGSGGGVGPLGDINSVIGDGTWAASLKDFIETIIGANPKIKLYLISPPEATGNGIVYKGTNSYGWTLKDLSVVMSQIGDYYSVQMIDLYSLSGFNATSIPQLTSDLLHPNMEGCKRLADIVYKAFVWNNNKGKDINPFKYNIFPGGLTTLNVYKNRVLSGTNDLPVYEDFIIYGNTPFPKARIQGVNSFQNSTRQGFRVVVVDAASVERKSIDFNGVGTVVVNPESYTDTGEKLQVNGTGKFTGNVIVPNGVLSSHAVNKSQLDAAISGVVTNKITQGGDSFGVAMSIGTNDGNNVQIKRSGSLRVEFNALGAEFKTALSNGFWSESTLSFADISNPARFTSQRTDAVPVLEISNTASTGSGDLIRFRKGISGTPTTVAGVRVDGRNYGADATAANDFITKGQYDAAKAIVDTALTTSQTNATLNAKYPSAPLPYVVFAPNVGSSMTYVKVTSTTWMAYSGVLLP